MSIHDESWDRPVCQYCNEEIKYGEKSLHYDGKCIKVYNVYDILNESVEKCETYD